MGILNFHRHAEQIRNPLHRRKARLDGGELIGKLSQGVKEALGKENEGCQGAEGEGILHHQQAPQPQHPRDRHQGNPFQRGRHRRVVKDGGVYRLDVLIVGGPKLLGVKPLPPENLHHIDTGMMFSCRVAFSSESFSRAR
jgi:hypothetical protein